MKLSRDPDTLRIPAFMRKKSITAKLKRPLVLTALDRKQADMRKPKKKRPKSAATRTLKKKSAQLKTATPVSLRSFSAPLMEFFEQPAPAAKQTQGIGIGTLTHYYNKIKVGVIALSRTLEVGDTISYQTEKGSYSQIVESMEIDRQPVFKAGKGREIGLKLRREPKIGSAIRKM